MSPVDTPLTVATAVSSWRLDVVTLTIVGACAYGYLRGHRRAAREGVAVESSRRIFSLAAMALWFLATGSFVGVYADTLFWVQALQVVLLLFVVPFGLASGRPVTVARAALGDTGRARIDRILASRSARVLTHPAVTSVLMLATPWLLYLTAWYPAVLQHRAVDQITQLVLVGVGLLYFYSRLQADPVPRRYPQMISMVISIAETLGDGLLGIVLWQGPAIAAQYYTDLGRVWGPSRATDQIIGAGILWVLGDILGVPFLLAVMRAFAVDEQAAAKEVDAVLDAAEATGQVTTTVGDEPGLPKLWWQDDPQLRDRFRRG
ncbi:cytochrome c oxidase assembly protein [Nocardia sp. NPDC049707]|uniref:cytochrome c oxidase assembly protein n=1 Tax=Nocardia sp. NPDC049707 TaxID=3154735 RepID=UPI003435A9EC